jgi:hypothetical protein
VKLVFHTPRELLQTKTLLSSDKVLGGRNGEASKHISAAKPHMLCSQSSQCLKLISIEYREKRPLDVQNAGNKGEILLSSLSMLALLAVGS